MSVTARLNPFSAAPAPMQKSLDFGHQGILQPGLEEGLIRQTNRSLDNTSHPGSAGPDDLVPSRYALRVGEIDVLVVSDGVFPMPATTMSTNADPAARAAWLKDMFLPDVFDWALNVVVLRSGDRTILIDAGLGRSSRTSHRAGRLHGIWFAVRSVLSSPRSVRFVNGCRAFFRDVDLGYRREGARQARGRDPAQRASDRRRGGHIQPRLPRHRSHRGR
jgi:hypothetical protein